MLHIGMNSYDLWTFLPTMAMLADVFRPNIFLYYCVDSMESFCGVAAEEIQAMDDVLTKRADIVCCVSMELYNKKSKYNENVYHTPHGVDYSLFARALSPGPIPLDLRGLSKPIVGFWGLISKDWIDYELVSGLAVAYPNAQFVFLGKIDEDPANLPRADNIHYLGVKSYETLPDYARWFDVAIIPFVRSNLTKNSNPLKALEYIASGLPVVTINIPELLRLEGKLIIVNNKEQFIGCCGEALRGISSEERRIKSESVSNEDWDIKYKKLISVIDSISEKKRRSPEAKI